MVGEFKVKMSKKAKDNEWNIIKCRGFMAKFKTLTSFQVIYNSETLNSGAFIITLTIDGNTEQIIYPIDLESDMDELILTEMVSSLLSMTYLDESPTSSYIDLGQLFPEYFILKTLKEPMEIIDFLQLTSLKSVIKNTIDGFELSETNLKYTNEHSVNN